MADDQDKRDPEAMSVELNEAFERLEKRAEAADSAEPEVTSRREVSAAAPQKGNPVGMLALLLALIGIGVASGAGYTAWMNRGEITSLDSALDSAAASRDDARVEETIARLTRLEREVEKRLTAVSDLESRLDEVTARLSEQSSSSPAVDQLAIQVEEAIAGLRAEMGTSSRDWLLAEVEYLIRLGAQRVEMQRDARGALTMFMTADEILQNAEGVAAFSLREALANDIAELRSVATVDVDGLFVQLGALKTQVDRLRQRTPDYEAPPVSGITVTDAGIMDRFMAFMGQVGSRLAALVDYRRDEEVIKPVLPPREEYYLRQNLVFQIQLAQLALLRGDHAIYDASLIEARQWVARHFDPEDAVTRGMITTLGELSGADIDRDMPDVSESLRAVRATLERFHTETERNRVR